MNIGDIFPAKEKLNELRDIESALFTRRKNAKVAGGIALISALIQFFILLWPYATSLLDATKSPDIRNYLNDPGKFIPLILVSAGALTYILLRRTGVLLKETREPFRYTFSVKAFNKVENLPGDRLKLKDADRLNLLHHDLTELINQRIKRFSILQDFVTKEGDTNLNDDARKSSHIDIFGYYALREDKNNDEWVIQVMPYIRIGPADAPATLAQSIRFPLTADDTPDRLDTHEYNQLLERVYSRVTTEIYAQIEKDIQNKIILFPTNYLKANALYHEAKDMANSNTINSFESAIKLYEEAIRIINSTFVKRISGFFLRIPLLRNIFIRYSFQFARIHTGYAKCLIYKNRIAALSGKKRNPVFVIRQNLKDIIRELEQFHFKIAGNSGISEYKNEENTFYALAYLTYPPDTFLRRLLLKPPQSLFNETRIILFNAYVVQALTDTLLNAFLSAGKFLNKAKAIAPDLTSSDPLYFLAQAYSEPNTDRAIFLLQKATELAPSFQIAQYDLAFWMEMKFRQSDEITYNRARSTLDEYDKVLRINPGNIAALAAQGYIYWLLQDLDKARRKFEEGYEIKAMVSETFIGQIIYGRARIFVEQGKINECYDLFNQALAANPNVGTYYIGDDSWMTYSFYDYISPKLLERFRIYHGKFNSYMAEDLFLLGKIGEEFKSNLDANDLSDELISELKKLGIRTGEKEPTVVKEKDSQGWIIRDGLQDTLHIRGTESGLQVYIKPDVSKKISDVVFSYILNDYGNANYNFYKRHGDPDFLKEATRAYTDSIAHFRDNMVAKYNKSLAILEQNNEESIKLLDDVLKNNPRWFEALASSVEIKFTKINTEIKSLEKQLKDLEEERKIKTSEAKNVESNLYEANKAINSSSDQQQNNTNNINQSFADPNLRFQKKPSITHEVNLKSELKTINDRINVLENNRQELQNKKKELWPKIGSIMQPTKLASLYEGMHLISLNNIDTLLNSKINWIRLDEDDVRALRIYISSVYYEIHDQQNERIGSCEKLFDILLTNYFPEDYNILLLKKELILRNSTYSKPSLDFCDAIIESSLIYWLEQDISNHYLYTLAKGYLKPEIYFAYLSKSVQVERNPELLDLFLPDEYVKSGGTIHEFLEIFNRFYDNNKTSEKSAVVYNRIGNSLCRMKHVHEGIGILEKSIEFDNPKPVYFYDMGFAYSEQGDWEKTRSFCQKALRLRKEAKQDPYGLEYYYRLLSEASFKSGQLNEFILAFEESGDLNDLPDSKAVIYNLLGNLLANSSLEQDAIPYYRKVLKLNKSTPIYFCNLGLTYAKLEKWNEAIENYTRALELRRKTPDDPYGLDYYYEFLSEAYIKTNGLDTFLDIFEKSGDLNDKPDKKAVVYNRVANIIANSGKEEDAIKYYEKAIDLDPSRPIYQCNLGLTHEKLGQSGEAIKWYQKAIERMKSSGDETYGLDYYYGFLLGAYMKMDRLKDFMEIFENSVDFRDIPIKKAVIYNRVGNTLANSNHEKDAVSYYQKAIELDNASPIYCSNLGLTFLKLELWSDAVDFHRRAVELARGLLNDPYGLDYYYEFFADACFKSGNFGEFQTIFEGSGDLNNYPDRKAVVYNHLGNLHANTGDHSHALRYYENAIQLDPLPIYYSNLGLSCGKLGQWKEAFKYHKKALILRRKSNSDVYGLDFYYENLSEASFQSDKLDGFLELLEGYGDLNDVPAKKAQIYNQVANLNLNSDKRQEAIPLYEKAIALDGSKPIYYSNLGLACRLLDRFSEAIELQARAIELRRDNPDDTYGFDYYYGQYADAFFYAGRTDEFLVLFEESGDMDAFMDLKASVYNRLGNLFANSGKVQESIPFYKKSIELDGTKPIYYSNLGFSFAKLGQRDEAIKNHNLAIDLRLKTPDDPYNLDYYQSLQNEANNIPIFRDTVKI